MYILKTLGGILSASRLLPRQDEERKRLFVRAPVCMCGARVLLFPSFIVQDFSRRAKNEKRSIAPDRQKRQGRERLLEHTDPYIAGSGNSISVEFPSKQEKQTRNGLLTEKKKKKSKLEFP